MLKMFKVYTVTLICMLCFQVIGFCEDKVRQGESLTITTYYPSPYGSYNQLSVGAGGLKLGKVIDNVEANKWTDIDISSKPSGGLYIISVVPVDAGPFRTYMILFSAGSQGVGITMIGGTAAASVSDPLDINRVNFRTQDLTESDSFALQINSEKKCNVSIGKILSYQGGPIK